MVLYKSTSFNKNTTAVDLGTCYIVINLPPLINITNLPAVQTGMKILDGRMWRQTSHRAGMYPFPTVSDILPAYWWSLFLRGPKAMLSKPEFQALNLGNYVYYYNKQYWTFTKRFNAYSQQQTQHTRPPTNSVDSNFRSFFAGRHVSPSRTSAQASSAGWTMRSLARAHSRERGMYRAKEVIGEAACPRSTVASHCDCAAVRMACLAARHPSPLPQSGVPYLSKMSTENISIHLDVGMPLLNIIWTNIPRIGVLTIGSYRELSVDSMGIHVFAIACFAVEA